MNNNLSISSPIGDRILPEVITDASSIIIIGIVNTVATIVIVISIKIGVDIAITSGLTNNSGSFWIYADPF